MTMDIAEADHGQLPPSNQLVGEGSGEPEERACFGHAEHQPSTTENFVTPARS